MWIYFGDQGCVLSGMFYCMYMISNDKGIDEETLLENRDV